MRKLPSSESEVRPTPRRRRGDLVLALFLALVLVPVAYESVTSCAARWQSMVGPTVTVETPILDTIQTTLAWGYSALHHQFSRAVHNTPWKPSLVIGCGIALAMLAIVPLRRVH